jgi:hypothetical protein
MIDPSIWDSEQVQQLTATQFKLYVYLISAADDEGRFKVNYRMIASKAFPLEDNYQASECENDMRELYGDKLIRLYDTEEGLCGDHPNWTRYQAIQKPRPSSIPTFEQGTPLQYDYSTTTVALQPNRIERNRKEENTRAATPEPDGSLMENLPQPSKPKGELKDEDAALWEDALTSKQPSSTWGNYGKERQSCGSLAKRSRELLSQTPYTDMRELVGAVLSEYDRLKRSERTSWWRTAAWTPSQVLARWSAVWDSLAKESEKSRMWEEATS